MVNKWLRVTDNDTSWWKPIDRTSPIPWETALQYDQVQAAGQCRQ